MKDEMKDEYFYGYINNMRYLVKNDSEQIAAFLINGIVCDQSTMITNIVDEILVKQNESVVEFLSENEFDVSAVINEMKKQSTGSTVVFTSYSPQGDKIVNRVILRSAAGYYLGSVIYEDGCRQPYDRESGYFPSEVACKSEFPDSIYLSDADHYAVENGWL